MNVCVNVWSVRIDYKSFPIILDSVYSSTIVNINIEKPHKHKALFIIEWSTQVGYFTTTYKIKVDF